MNTSTSLDQRSLLVDLMDIIQSFPDSSDRYFTQTGERELFNPTREDVQHAEWISESIPMEFFEQLGIRSITLDRPYESFPLPNNFDHSMQRDVNQFRWHVFRNTSFVENLRAVFSSSHVIAFSDWASIDGASQLWDGFLHDVIKPLNRTDIHFIFYLGDLTRKLTHEVDEILDIVSDFSTHGTVTFFLHESEAEALWSVLYGEVRGVAPGSRDLQSRYNSIFRAMKVDHMVIYSSNQARLLSSEVQFELTGRASTGVKISQQHKDNFNAGYSFGLLQHLDITQCIALGLTAYGAFLEYGASPNRKAMTAYVKSWIEKLESQK